MIKLSFLLTKISCHSRLIDGLTKMNKYDMMKY